MADTTSLAEDFKTISDVILKQKTKEAKIETIRMNLNTKVHKAALALVFNSTLEWKIPQGRPPFNPSEAFESQGLFKGMIIKRKLDVFLKGFSAPNYNQAKMENHFIGCLESVDPGDAEILVNMKEGKLPAKYKGITKSLVKEAFGKEVKHW